MVIEVIVPKVFNGRFIIELAWDREKCLSPLKPLF